MKNNYFLQTERIIPHLVRKCQGFFCKMKEINKILERLKEKLSLKNDYELTKYLGLSSGTITNWRNRKKIPYETIFTICENKKIDINYIFYGKIKNIEEKINFLEKINIILQKSTQEELEIYYNLIKIENLRKKEY